MRLSKSLCACAAPATSIAAIRSPVFIRANLGRTPSPGYWTLALRMLPFAPLLRGAGADFPQGELRARNARVAELELAGVPDRELAHPVGALPDRLLRVWHRQDDHRLVGG